MPGKKIVLGEDLNCVMNEIDKCREHPFEQKKTVIQEIKTLMRTHNLIDSWSCKHPNKHLQLHGIIHPRKSIAD